MLSGGAHEHLGILGDDTTYFTLTGHNCTRLVLLVVVAGTTHYEASYLREEHSEATRLFCENIGVEMLLKKNSVTTEDACLNELRNRDTSTFTTQLSKILDFLFG